MLIRFKARLRAGMAVAALVPAMAFASTISVSGASDTSFAGDVLVSRVQPASGFLSWASRPSSGAVVVLSHNEPGPVLSVPTTTGVSSPPLVSLHGGADLSLWNLVAAVHAQQRGDLFESVGASVALQQPMVQLTAEPLTVVPLPPAVWLFVMGVLGLAGTRVTHRSGLNRRAPADEEARSFPRSTWGGALPA